MTYEVESIFKDAGHETTRLDRASVREDPTWGCKIGIRNKSAALPAGCDLPMREAVEAAFKQITGLDADFCFSGWGEELTEIEADIVDGRAD